MTPSEYYKRLWEKALSESSDQRNYEAEFRGLEKGIDCLEKNGFIAAADFLSQNNWQIIEGEDV